MKKLSNTEAELKKKMLLIKKTCNNALISLTEMIRNALGDDNFACVVFVDLQMQKAYDTVNHAIPGLRKLHAWLQPCM